MHLRLAIPVFVACVCFAGVAHADQLADIKQKGEIVIGVRVAEPNSFVDPKTGEMVGYEIDIAKAVAKAMGVKPVFKPLASAARIPQLQQGNVDILAASLTHNRQREAQVDFSLTMLVTGQRVLVITPSDVKDLPDLAGKKVVAVKGGTEELNLRKMVPSVDIVDVDTIPQAVLALQHGEGVGYVADEGSLANDYSEFGGGRKDYAILPTNVSVEPLALGIRKGEKGVKAAVDDTLRALEKSGEAEKIFFKWYGPGTKANLGKRAFKFETDEIDR
jgi:ABC-type amino acid transport/signal transduction systems, periplasmic component/domain